MSSENKVSLVLVLLAVSFVLTTSGHLSNCTAVNSTYVICAVQNGTMGGGCRHKGRGRGMISGLFKVEISGNRNTNNVSPQLTKEANTNNPAPHL